MADLLPFEIFLQSQFVFSMAVVNHNKPYSAPCFYVFRPEAGELTFVSSPDTLHMQAAMTSDWVAGSVYRSTETVEEIQGVQFRGKLKVLSDREEQTARHRFTRRFPYPVPEGTKSWCLELLWVKFTDNTRGFGFKEIWTRSGDGRF
ncbi:MAG: hypothetical protein CSA81_02285 [Acidobacteria bacterium]|nr:MAG: hypothetical protein CSA81_02285 [Acidobacteriota bacterium]